LLTIGAQFRAFLCFTLSNPRMTSSGTQILDTVMPSNISQSQRTGFASPEAGSGAIGASGSQRLDVLRSDSLREWKKDRLPKLIGWVVNVGAAALSEQCRRRVIGKARKTTLGSNEVMRSPRPQTFRVGPSPLPLGLGFFAAAANRFENRDRRGAPPNTNRIDLTPNKGSAGCSDDRLRGQNRRSEARTHLFKTRGEVHAVAKSRIVETST